MMAAGTKNPPSAAGFKNSSDIGKADIIIRQQEIHCNALPDWMQRKVAHIVAERAQTSGCDATTALALVSGEAFTTACAEFQVSGAELPSHLASTLKSRSFSALDDFELAAIIITETDARACAAVCGPENLQEFTTLKMQTLQRLLEGGRQ